MNQTLKLIETRYSCRAYTDAPLNESEIAALGNAAIQAPSAMNRQPWFVSVVTDRALLAEAEATAFENLNGDMRERIASRGGKVFYNAPCMVFIALNDAMMADGGRYGYVDMGILAQNVVLAATSMGLATVHVGMASLVFQGDKADYFNKRLGIPEGYSCGYAVLVGHAEGDGTPHQTDPGKVVYIG